MAIKDYYKILMLEPGATEVEIKKAYRKLALQHHPDKNGDDLYAAATFSEIKEAYEILSSTKKRNIYLQEPWYNKATGNTSTAKILTPITLLKQALLLEKETASMDVFRMDNKLLFYQIDAILTEEAMNTLVKFNDRTINEQLIKTILKILPLLPYTLASSITNRLLLLQTNDEAIKDTINYTIQLIGKNEKWQQYQWILIVLATLIICGIIWYGAS
jgi:molecular chaperone DnaJ